MMNSRPTDILLVEDNPDHVELILDGLAGNHVINKVYVVNDGQAALDFVFRQGHHENAPRPGLILLDIKLPQVNGIEVVKRIKANEETQTIPVVMLTTSETDSDITTSYRNGANSYLVKPVVFETFMSVIQELKLYWLVMTRLPR